MSENTDTQRKQLIYEDIFAANSTFCRNVSQIYCHEEMLQKMNIFSVLARDAMLCKMTPILGSVYCIEFLFRSIRLTMGPSLAMRGNSSVVWNVLVSNQD